MYIDSHCHLNCIDLAKSSYANFDELMQAIINAGVERLLCVSIDLESIEALVKLANDYPSIFFSVGVHPNTLLKQEVSDKELLSWTNHPKCIAIGETGLDYYRLETGGDKHTQQQRFIQHIQIAAQLQRPLIVHTRHAADDTLAILREHASSPVIMHCFAEDWAIAKRCLEQGHYISLSGIATFKNAHQVHEVAQKVPIERLLIETDSPYLAPAPYRGKQNDPSLLPLICQRIAELRGMSDVAMAEATTENFYRLFPSAL